MASLIWFRVLAAGAVGLIAWRGPLWAIALSILVPCLIAAQPTRVAAGAASFAYYAAASSPVIAVAVAYWPASDAGAVLMWLAAAAILSLPWLLCWTRREPLRPWAVALAVVLTAVPPLCIVGWASPLVAAGVLFPNTGWLGLAAVLALAGLLLHEGARAITLLIAAAISLLLNAQAKPLRAPSGWEAEMTHIHRQAEADDLADFAIEERLQRAALSSHARFLVFPEGVVRRWTDATDAFWAVPFSASGKTLMIGAGQPIPSSPLHHNSVVIVGEHPRPAVHQRIPVPGGMWNPLRPEGGFALDLYGPGTVDVGGQRVAILICYEQLLTWPMLRSALARPTLLVGVSNSIWCNATVVPSVQRACLQSWARLFGLPVLSAVNI